MPADNEHRFPWKLVLNVITIGALLGLIFATRSQIAESFSRLADINAYLLFLFIPLQGLNHHAYARLYQSMLSIFQDHIRYASLYRLSLEVTFVNTVFPSAGVSGFSYFGIRGRSYGITAAKATLTQFMRFALVFISFQVLLFIGLFMLSLSGSANRLILLIAGSLTTSLFISSVAVVYIIGSRHRINVFFTALTKFLNRIIHFVRPNYPETINIERAQILFTDFHENFGIVRRNPMLLKKPLLFALLANAAEIGTIYVTYLAFGNVVNPGAVIIAYAVANFAGILSVLPGGIGVYEGLMTATLAGGGIPPSVSLPVTIMFRVLTMLIQLPPGYYFYRKNIHDSHQKIV